MRTKSLTHWISLLAVFAGLLLMRIPALACQCETGACCVLAPHIVTPPPSASAEHNCCSRCAATAPEPKPTDNPAPQPGGDDQPTNCDCSCTLCKTTNPTPNVNPGATELRELPVGFAMEWASASAPEVDRLTLLRPPRL